MARAGLRDRKRKEYSLPEAIATPEARAEQDPEPVASNSDGRLPVKRPRQDSDQRCRFLELPRELRDEIYKHVISGDRSIELRQRNFITNSSLIGVNNQITEEYLDTILFYAPEITTTVRNHNFAHIVTFLNRLSEAQFKRFQSDGKAQKTRQRRIRIILTYTSTKVSTRPQLNRWLDRFDDPNRRGAEIEFRYAIDNGTYGQGGGKQKPTIRSTAGPRSNEEARKILGARGYSRYGQRFGTQR